ncbi:MAG: hypothetical protein R3E50_10050 [Halioglobus sp.]
MKQATELWVDRTNLRATSVVATALPVPGPGEVVVAIDQFGLTATTSVTRSLAT